ncbi:MAG TPA: TlpA disulfide reductase family protein [Ramlibacter sp.]
MDRRRWIIAAAGAVSAWAGPAHAAMRKAWPRRRATPALHIVTLDGQPWNLSAERGHAVLLNFWASWCEPCRSEMPMLEKFAREQRETGLHVLAVNYREGEPAVRRFLKSNALALDVLRDADGAAAKAFGVNIFPSTVAIDAHGRTHVVAVGELDVGDLAELVRQMA